MGFVRTEDTDRQTLRYCIVFLVQYTQKESQKLGLVGWVCNTPQNSVNGQIQGTREQVELM